MDVWRRIVCRNNRGFLGSDSSALTQLQQQERRQFRFEIDLNKWNLRVWAVAASGFLTDSYNLFATNVILTCLAFTYWSDGFAWYGMVINVSTLVGSAFGQLLFGFLADYYGRSSLYGVELLVVIVSTFALAFVSTEHRDPASFLSLFAGWRFVMGIGVGAEYPLSAIVTSEWSSTHSRGTMLSSVFMMQPIGQACAQLVGLLALVGFERTHGLSALQCGLDTRFDEECRGHVDTIWRVVVGVGCIPSLVAILFRFYLFDSGIYNFDVKNNPARAMVNMHAVYGDPQMAQTGDSEHQLQPQAQQQQNDGQARTQSQARNQEVPIPVQFSRSDMHNYFIKDKNWIYLMATSVTWFVLDVGFFGLSLDNRITLADMWSTNDLPQIDENLPCWDSVLPGGNSTVPGWQEAGKLPGWLTDRKNPCTDIYGILFQQAIQYLITVSIASIAGSAAFVMCVDRLPRRAWLSYSFLLLSAIFITTGVVYYLVTETSRAHATIFFVALSNFCFNFGANTLTFLIPAEIFPTCYRCSCHGISAAAGKVGSIIAILAVYGIDERYHSPQRHGLVFVVFGVVVASGAFFSWAFIPQIQRRVSVEDRNGRVRTVLESKTLEELGEGRERAIRDGEVVTLCERFAELGRRRPWAKRAASPESS